MNYQERFIKFVWPRIEEFLNTYSQATYSTWIGQIIWNENGDLLRIITKYCEDEFGLFSVHNESKVSKSYFKKFKEQLEAGERTKKTYSIDIDITDARECENMEDFSKLTHGLFIEVKQLVITLWGKEDKEWGNVKDKIDGFEFDCKKLKDCIDSGFCEFGIAIMVDNGDLSGNHHISDRNAKLTELKAKYSPVIPIIWQKM